MSDATDESHIIVVIISVVSSLRNGASGEQWCYGDGRVTRDDIEPSFWRRASRRERICWTTAAATRDDNMASTTTARDSRRLARAAAERPRRNNGNVRLDVLQQWIREYCVRDTYGFVCLWPIESSTLLTLL